jgi:homoserine O-succinyltransferase/O-acetyltransferase
MTNTEKFALGGRRGAYRGTLHVGLVNNVPDAALRATELQFARLLKQASGSLDVRLHLFSLRQIERSELARSRMEGFYADAETLPAAGIDALIVSGGEPQDGGLRAKSHQDALAHLVDWAEIGTVSSLFSGPATHSAVFQLSGVAPKNLTRKLSGVFAAEGAHNDPLLTSMPTRFHVPHSRRSTLAEGELMATGYRILSHLSDGGVDSFARTMPGHSLFMFLQGHPEYDAETLGREYLREMDRFLGGESLKRPAIPEYYFDRATENALAALEADSRGPDDLARYSGIISGALPLQSWRVHTIKLFGNWLALVAAEKLRRMAHNARPQKAPRLIFSHYL